MEEKILTINLAESSKKRRAIRAAYATRTLRHEIAKQTKAKTVKLGGFLNSAVWSRGAKKPPSSVRVKAIIDGDVAKAELLGHDYVEFKPTSVAKREKMLDKLRARLSPKEQQKEELEKKIDEGKPGNAKPEAAKMEPSVEKAKNA